MALAIILSEASGAAHPDIVSIKAEELSYPIRRMPAFVQLPNNAIITVDLNRSREDISVSAVLDEELSELNIRSASGTFTSGETIFGDATWNAGVTPVRTNGSVIGALSFDNSASPQFIDEAVAANNVAANDVNLFPAISGLSPQNNDAYYIGTQAPVRADRIQIGTAGVKAPGAWTINYEYSRGNGNWGTLTGVTDNTVEFTGAPGTYYIYFNIPTDYAQDSVFGILAYWRRYRLSAVTSPIGVRPLATQLWTLSTPSARLIGQETNKLFISHLGHDDMDFFVHGETITGVTSATTAIVDRPLATFHRWEQIARNWSIQGDMVLRTPNDIYTVKIESQQFDQQSGRERIYQGAIKFVRIS